LRERAVVQDQATQQLAELLGRIKNLPGQNLEPPQFFANYLQLSAAATGSRGGAIWVLQPNQGPQCYCHIELELCGIAGSEHQKQLVAEAVQRTLGEQKSLVIPPASTDERPEGQLEGNQCPYPLFFKPLRAGDKVAMVLQMIGSDELNPHDYRTVAGLLEQIGQAGEQYLAHRRAAVLEDDRKALARLLQYAEGVHDSLDPEKVIYQVANLGREAMGCSRAVVWVDPQVKRGLRAVSGVDKPDRRAVLMQSLEKLSKQCLEIAKPIVAARGQLAELPEEEKLTELLKGYFNVSQLDQIFLQPIEKDEKFLGVVIAEGFDEQTSTNLAGIIGTVSKHAALALSNALEMASVPLVRPLAKLHKIRDDPKKRRKWTTILVAVAAALVLGAFLPWTIRIECGCELGPRQMRQVESPLEGVQIIKIVKPRGPVQAGEVIVQLDDLELNANLNELEAEYEREQINLDQELSPTGRKLSQLQLEKLRSQIELLKWQINQCQVKSPITGTIMTAQLELREGLTVKKGDPICEIADLAQWELRLDVSEKEIAWVQRALEAKDAAEVEFYLRAYPEYKLKAAVAQVNQISQMARINEEEKNAGHVFEIRVDVPGEELQEIMAGLRDGSTGRAKIDTVRRPLIYVLLRKVIRFFRVTMF